MKNETMREEAVMHLEATFKRWDAKMSKLNYRLLRMMDDYTGDRPMKPWKFKKALKFAGEVREVMKTATEINKNEFDDRLDDFLERCRVWAARIIYMNTWAYYLENMENIDQTMTDMQTEIFDDNGNRISGLDEDKKKLVTTVCRIRERLTRLLIKIPVDTEDYKYVLDKLDLFNRMCREIMKTE